MRRFPFFSRTLCLTVLLLLGACGTSRSPAPIVPRTGEGARPVESTRPAPVVVPAPPLPAVVTPVPVAESSGVETAPVRSSGIESRPLESRPLGAPAPSPGAPGVAAAPGAPGTSGTSATAGASGTVAGIGSLRTTPKGLKRPYSDATLAEMKAGEGASIVAASAEAAKADASRAEAAKGETPKADAAKTEATKSASSPDLAWPAKGRVIQTFAEPKHMGIVLDGRVGDAVGAAADGRVIFSGPGPRGYGNLIIVKHDADTVTVYAHNKSLLVKEGQSVKRGQKIAEVGDTGADKAGLHFEVRKQGKPIDPQKLLPKR